LDLAQKSAEKNHGPAMWEVGQAYENGQGVHRDLMSATDWYRRSRKRGQVRGIEITYLRDQEVGFSNTGRLASRLFNIGKCHSKDTGKVAGRIGIYSLPSIWRKISNRSR